MNINQQIADLNGTIAALLAQYPELGDDEVLRADMLEGATDIQEVLSRIHEKIADAETMANSVGSRISALSERQARYRRQEEAFRTMAQGVMERASLKKVTLPEATLSLSFRSPAPVVTDEAQLPDALCKFKRSADMAKIKEAMAAGTEVPGVTMGNGKTILTVRVK